MSDILCISCGHGPHQQRPCANPRCKCTTFQNATLLACRALANINNMLATEIPAIKSLYVDALDILIHAFPEAVAKVEEKRAELREKLQKEEEERQNAATAAATTDGERNPDAGITPADGTGTAAAAERGAGRVVTGSFGSASEDNC